MANRIPRVPVREQDPQVRAANFEEVCHGYDRQEALLDSARRAEIDRQLLPAAVTQPLNAPLE